MKTSLLVTWRGTNWIIVGGYTEAEEETEDNPAYSAEFTVESVTLVGCCVELIDVFENLLAKYKSPIDGTVCYYPCLDDLEEACLDELERMKPL